MKILAFLLLLTASAPAQQAQQTDLRLLAFPRVKDAGPIELQVGDSVVEVDPPSNRLSDPVSVPSQATWRFGRRIQGADGERGFETWGEAKSTGTGRQILILLRKGKRNEDGFHVVSLKDGPKHFGDGEIYFLNLARQEIAGEVGGVKFGLKPADEVVIKPKADKGPELCHASLYIRPREKWRPFFSSNWPLRERTRGLVFLYNGAGKGRVRMHTIRDFL